MMRERRDCEVSMPGTHARCFHQTNLRTSVSHKDSGSSKISDQLKLRKWKNLCNILYCGRSVVAQATPNNNRNATVNSLKPTYTMLLLLQAHPLLLTLSNRACPVQEVLRSCTSPLQEATLVGLQAQAATELWAAATVQTSSSHRPSMSPHAMTALNSGSHQQGRLPCHVATA